MCVILSVSLICLTDSTKVVWMYYAIFENMCHMKQYLALVITESNTGVVFECIPSLMFCFLFMYYQENIVTDHNIKFLLYVLLYI